MTGASVAAEAAESADDLDILRRLAFGQSAAIAAVVAVLPALASAAARLSASLKAGGRLIYVGAGSSGLIAAQDGAELPGTYGLSPERLVFLIAGASEPGQLDSGAEDDEAAARAGVSELGRLDGDMMIAVSASGTTPYTLAAAGAGKASGACLIAIAGRQPSPLLGLADYPILLSTGEELVAGSTRMAAGTAQKCALGLLSTLANIRLGHVYAGRMVNMRPDNAKLQQRASAIVRELTGVSREAAWQALQEAGFDVKTALCLAAGAASLAEARALLGQCGGYLDKALPQLRQSTGT
jgi:N-acetylmuramic acid 6-phosphate etherase